MQKQKLTEKLHRWARLTLAMIAVGTMAVHDGWAINDIGRKNISIAFEKGNGDNQYLHIGFITEVAMANDPQSLKNKGYHVVKNLKKGTWNVSVDDEDSDRSAGIIANTDYYACYFGYKTSQESENDNIYELFFKSNEAPISWPDGYSYIGNIGTNKNEFEVEPPGLHYDYTAVLGTIRRDRKKEHRAMASPLAMLPYHLKCFKYPNGCNKAYDSTDETWWEGQFAAVSRDNWDLAFCNAISKPTKLDTHLTINADKGYLSFFKYVPQFDGYNSQKSSVAIVMHRKDPSTGKMESELIFKQDFAYQEDTESGSWFDENPDVVGNKTGKFKVYHGMSTLAKHKDETMAKWDEWRIYFMDGCQLDAENLSFTVYQVHDHVLQYRTFSMQLSEENINLVDPYINVNASKDAIGSICQTLVFNNTIKYKQLKNKATGDILQGKTESSEGNMVTFVLPPTDEAIEYEAVVWCTAGSDSQELVEHHVTFTTPILHSIDEMTVSVDYNLDDKLIMNPENVIQWRVKNPEVEDILPSDQFMIFRANNADYSDEVCIANVSRRKDGVYEYRDKISEEFYKNTDEEGNRKAFYRVTRAFVYSYWQVEEGNYNKKGEINQPLALPQVTNVSFEKTQGFDIDHKVKVRVELGNPWNNAPEDPVEGTEYVLYDNTDQLVLMFSSDRCKLVSNTDALNRFTYLGKNDKSLFANLDGFKMQMNAEGYLTFAEEGTTDKFVASKDNNGNYSIRYYQNGQGGYPYYLQLKEEEDNKYVVAGIDPIRWSFVPGENLHRKYRWDPNASIVITRSGNGKDHNPVDDVNKTIVVQGNKVQWDNQKKCYYVEVNDVQTFGYTFYYYSATVDRGSSTYLMPENPEVKSSAGNANACYTETMAPVTDLTATYGETARPDGICLEWQIEDNSHLSYQIQRSLHGKNNWGEPTKIEGTEIHYLDKDCQIGEVYDYKLTAQLEFRNTIYTKMYQVTGSRGYYGSISGAITMPNGQHMPGTVRVTLKATQNISYSAVEGYRAAASVKAGETVVQTTTDGTFHFEHVLLDRENTKYKVSVAFDDDRNVNFENPAGGSNEFEVTMNRDLTEYTGCNYVCKDTYRYSGRVLYQGTTIPVRDVQFTFNDKVIMGANGQPVATDQKGNFSFDVPRAQATVAARMEGHTLLNEGKIKNKEGQDTFTPTSDLEGLQLWDQTTVRLVGRLVGGNKQGQLPLGFGASTNNLGDDLKLVLELEGDDTALLVYDEKNPEVISRDGMEYSQELTLNDGKTELVDKTVANFKKHRIEIYPNIETGEFCIDLYPTKYKITELSARGYSTLYNQGEGIEVLDLSDAAASVQTAEYYADGKKTTQYNDTYNRIYHSPVYVHFTQYRYGLKQPYYGADKVLSVDLKGESEQVILANYNKETEQVTYTFGYPVYTEGQPFTLEAFAYEKYYYNGDENSARTDSCKLDTDATLIVNNGFVSSDSRLTLPMDTDGKAYFNFRPSNADFTNMGEQNLRTLSAQVLVNGHYYDAYGIRAFVMGSRHKGNDAMAVTDGEIQTLDIIRDPYGSKSYAWRESGTKYHFEAKRTFSASVTPKFSAEISASASNYFGNFLGISFEGSMSGVLSAQNIGAVTKISGSFSYPAVGYEYYHKAAYDMTINEKVSTSSDYNMIGARADLYIGLVETYALNRTESFSVLNAATYEALQPSIEGGSVRIVQQGKDANGEDTYLAITEGYEFALGEPRQFVYTQQHILNTLIPDLWQQYKSSILTCSHADAQRIADEQGKIVFRLLEGKTYTDSVCYETLTPSNGEADATFTPLEFLETIQAWENVVMKNESRKVAALQSDPYLVYDISSGSSINHSEACSWYDNYYDYATTGGFNWGSMTYEPEIQAALESLHLFKKQEGNGINSDGQENIKTIKVRAPGYEFDWSIDPGVEIKYESNSDCLTTQTGATGYYLQTDNDSYLMQDVHSVYPGHWSAINQDDNDEALVEDKSFYGWVFITNDYTRGDTAQAKLKDFVYTVHAGAERSPWYAPDTTHFFFPGTPLTAQTMKIDNPKIYIDQPVASNLATDEKATYRIRLTNESEMTIPDYSTWNASSFVLRIKPNTNPNGANVYYNGSPLIEGLSIGLKPGTSMEGVIQLERVGDAYDFDSLVVQFFDHTYTLVSEQAISAHFVPTSSPIKMAQPANKWVMNTLSAKDETGYYIPVKLSDFDTNYANFDHIELQYKKHTEGDDRWVNQCSYFFDEELYDQANGNKELVTGRTIENIKFHGDMDPIEMEYDLRAVTFCRLGTGFVTRTSEVITGTKDTRAPEVFGMPKPTDGILTFEDVISIPFNEPIAYNYLDKTANFQVMGYTNEAPESYGTCMRIDAERGEARSQVVRNLTSSNYTFDMMVQVSPKDTATTLFTLQNPDGNIALQLEYWPKGFYGEPQFHDVLVLFSNQHIIASEKLNGLSLQNAMTHVGLSVNEGVPTFYIEGQELKPAVLKDTKTQTSVKYEDGDKILGYISLGGSGAQGNKIADLRLWNKALTLSEFSKYKAKHLSPTTAGLIGHWPINEARGEILYDEVNGADLTMQGASWHLPEGEYSLHLDNKPVQLTAQNCYKFMREENDDYTLTFWYRIEDLKKQGNVQLFAAGSSHNDGDGIIIAADGTNLKLLSKGKEYTISQLAKDDNWHFVGVTANKSHNTVSLYHDGLLTEAFSGQDVSGIASEYVQLGGDGFVGNLDCLTFWHVALTPNTIMQTYTTEPSGHEMELQYYLPFETNDRNDQNTIISEFSPCNQVYKLDREGNRLAPDTLFVATGTMADRNTFCPLRTLTGLENLPFNWTSTLNELQINIKKADNAINHQQLFVTVRNVEDLAGNTLANAEMLSLYVDRNVLTWDKREYIDTIRYGEGAEFDLQWTNACGKRLAYSVENYNSWLTADVEMGEADPAGYGTVKFRVDQGLAPGEYTAFVYLVDENKLASPMYIKIIVKAEAPDWQLVDQQEYAFSMNMIGKVFIQGNMGEVIDQDTRDIVAAFYDGKCVGKTNINSKSKYNLFMTIYGNNAMLPKSSGKNKTDGAAIEFRLWRASTGHIEILESHDPNATDKAKDAVRFADQTVAGSTQNPVILRVTEQSIQQLNLKKGWNWISFNVEPTDVSSANKLFLDNEPFSQDDVLKFNDEFFSMYVDGIGWDNTSTDNSAHMNVAIGRTYKLYMHQAGTAYVQGSQISDEKRVITLQPGQWNNMAYLLRVDQPINTAMSSYLASKENEGSIIKSIDQFAVASVDGNETKWEGSLEYLHPGQGYYIYHAGKQEAKIYFSNDEVAAQSAPTRGSLEAETALQHSTSMPIVAAFAPQVEAEPTDQVYAYVGDELVGHASLIDCGGMGRRYFLSVNAEQGDQVTFAQVRDNEVIALCDATLSYDADQVVGTLDQPMLLNTTGHMVSVTPNVFTQYVDFTICTPGIDRLGSAIQICVYNAAGALVWEREVLASTSGLTRQRMDGSWLTPGVYVAKVMAGGRTESVRLIRK